MKCNEFKRWLISKGVQFERQKGSHITVTLGDNVSIFPNHGSKEMKEPLRKAIIKQLGLRD